MSKKLTSKQGLTTVIDYIKNIKSSYCWSHVFLHSLARKKDVINTHLNTEVYIQTKYDLDRYIVRHSSLSPTNKPP